MAYENVTRVIWYDTIGRIPIRVGISEDLTAPEVLSALEEFTNSIRELAVLPNADRITIGEAYRMVKEGKSS
jgi:hypothetical protein